MVGTSPFREASEGYPHSVVNVVLCKKYKKTWHYTVLLETANCGQVNGHLQFYFVIIPEDPAEQFSAEETRPGHRIHGWPSVKYTAEPFPSFQCSMVPSRPSIGYISHKGDREWRSIYRLSLTHRRTDREPPSSPLLPKSTIPSSTSGAQFLPKRILLYQEFMEHFTTSNI